jgi:soluble lytic murein transglycosylase
VKRALVALALVVAVAGAGLVYVNEREPAWWVRLWYPLEYRPLVTGYAEIYELDPALVAAVIYTESRFHADTRSPAGAVGLMQLLPDTARGIARRTGGTRFTEDDLLNPDINVRYGCWYLRHLREKYDDEPGTLALALAAYHAGQGNVDEWIDAASPGRPVRIRFAETREYIRGVLHVRALYRRAYAEELGLARALYRTKSTGVARPRAYGSPASTT